VTELSENEEVTERGVSAPGWKPLVIRIAKWVIAVIVMAGLIYAGRSALTQWRQEHQKVQGEIAGIDAQLINASEPDRVRLRQRRDALVASLPSWRTIRWGRCLAAAALYALGLIPSGFLLRRALISLGQRPRFKTVMAAQLLGHLGKYVPGKAMVIVLRAGVLARDGVKPLQATLSVFLETFLMMAVGGTVAGVVVWWLPVPGWISLLAIGISVVASLPTLPPILKIVAARLTRAKPGEMEAEIGWGLFVSGWAWSSLSWLLIGASFTLLVTAIPSVEPLPDIKQLYLVCTAAISLAVVIGFASLLPGGAGIRELVVTTVLAVALGPTHGILAAIAARILFVVVEGLVASAAWLWIRTGGQSPGREPSSNGSAC